MSPAFTVVVCTRERPRQLARTLDSLRSGSVADFPIVVVDQSAEPLRRDDVDVVHDRGTGLSRARNVGPMRPAA